MRQSIVIAAILTAVLAPAAAASIVKPAIVKVVLHDTATVWPDGNGFFTLGEISDISGGTPEMRDKLDNVEVGRAPLDGNVRHLELGDVALKLRQAGIDPFRDLTLGGAENLVVSKAAGTPAQATSTAATGTTSSSPVTGTANSTVPAASPIVIKRGDTVTLVLQDDTMIITATGESLDNGAVGDLIHVHRDGMTTNVEGHVLDGQTVQMEM